MNASTQRMVEKAQNEATAAARAYWDAAYYEPKADLLTRSKLRRKLDDALGAWRLAQQAARREFASERGWRISNRWRGFIDYPCVDHPERYLTREGKPAILSHSYAEWTDIRAYASSHGFKVERLEWSWHYVGCIAVLFTRPESLA
jgi:hypothetical protein